LPKFQVLIWKPQHCLRKQIKKWLRIWACINIFPIYLKQFFKLS